MKIKKSWNSLFISASVFLCLFIGIMWTLILSGCDLAGGACVGTGGIIESCKEFDQATCTEFENSTTNGNHWEYFSGSACEDVGYPYYCEESYAWFSDSGTCSWLND